MMSTTGLLVLKLSLIGLMMATPFMLMLLPGEWALCAVIAEYFFFPTNAGFSINGGILSVDGIPFFTYLQLLQCIGLIANMMMSVMQQRALAMPGTIYRNIIASKYQFIPSRGEKTLILLFSFAAIAQFTSQFYKMNVLTIVPFTNFVMNYVDVFASVVFLLACAMFIRSKKHIDQVLMVIVMCGLALSTEMMLTYFVPSVKHAVGQYSILYNGKFRSLFLEDAVAVPLWSAIATIISAYFYQSRRNILYLVCILICVLPALLDFTRSVLIGLGVVGMLWMVATQRSTMRRGVMMMAALVLLVGVIASTNVLNEPLLDQAALESMQHMTSDQYAQYQAERKTTYAYFTRRIENIGTLNSSLIRVGQTLRGWQIVDTMPFGAGPNFLRYYMASDSVPIFDAAALMRLDALSPQVREGYERVAVKKVQTEMQIGYLDFIASFGIPGLLVELLAIGLIGMGMLKTVALPNTGTPDYYLRLAVTCMLVLYAVFFLFNTTPLLYVLFLMMLHVNFLLNDNDQWVS